MAKTPNHGYNVPEEGEEDWHEPLNENFERYDTDIELRGRDGGWLSHEPKDGAKFFHVGDGRVYVGDGSEWNSIQSTGDVPTFRRVRLQNEDLGYSQVSHENPEDGRTEVVQRFVPDEERWKLELLRNNELPYFAITAVRNDDHHGVGIGTETPMAGFHVTDKINGNASTENHAAIIENTASGGGDVLALKAAENQPGSGTNFITFKGSNDASIGSIEGDGNGGVTFKSGGGDYAEWVPRQNPDETIEAGDVVGVHEGEVSLTVDGADRVMVVSTRPIVTGNDPGSDGGNSNYHEKVAFVGQVPTKVRGPIEAGDIVVPSGEADGTGRGVSPASYTPGDGPVVGQAWASAEAEGVTEVTVAVGVESGEVNGATAERQADQIEKLEAEIMHKDDRIEELSGRLAAVEERMSRLESADSAPVSADD